MKEDANIAAVLCITRAATATLLKCAPLRAPQMKMPIMATNNSVSVFWLKRDVLIYSTSLRQRSTGIYHMSFGEIKKKIKALINNSDF